MNEQLLQGPNPTSSLVGVLLRFRKEGIAIVGDIESMFYQVRVSQKDRSFQKFLWWENGDCTSKPLEYQMNVHLFVSTTSPSCANYALRQTAFDNQCHFSETVIDTLLRNFYVDDCLKSVETVPKAVSLVKDLQMLLRNGGFRITKW